MFTPGTQTTNSINSQPSRPRRTIRPPIRYADTIHDLPYTQNDIQIETTNKKNSRACIRHIKAKLINEQYLPEIVLTKLDTHSLKGFTNYAKHYLLDNYNPFATYPIATSAEKKH